MTNSLSQKPTHSARQAAIQRTREVHLKILEDHFDNGMSIKQLSEKYHLAESSLSAIIRKEKLADPTRARNRVPNGYDPRKLEHRRPLSGTHVKLGVLVSKFISSRNMNLTEFGRLVGLTRNKVSELISGSYDIPLTKLVMICKLLDITISELTQGMHDGPISATPPPSRF